VVSNNQTENVEFKVAGSEFDFLVGKSAVTLLDDIPLLGISYNISGIPQRISKFILDKAISIPVLIFIWPFIYFFHKVTKQSNSFVKFVIKIPSVVFGNKSLVGPLVKRELNLFLGKVGLTGLWFTEGYDKNDNEEALKLDIYYAKNQNIWLDLEILGKTISKMFNERKS
jgi:hypothetical protein